MLGVYFGVAIGVIFPPISFADNKKAAIHPFLFNFSVDIFKNNGIINEVSFAVQDFAVRPLVHKGTVLLWTTS